MKAKTRISSHIWTVWHPKSADTVTHQTFDNHLAINRKHGEVYWGVITKREYKDGHPFEKVREEFQARIAKGEEVFLFIGPRDRNRNPMRGRIKKILTKFPSWEDSEKVADYYKSILKNNREYRIIYWFLLKEFRNFSHSELTRVKLSEKFNTTLNGSTGYPYPCGCQFEGKKPDRKKRNHQLRKEIVEAAKGIFEHSPELTKEQLFRRSEIQRIYGKSHQKFIKPVRTIGDWVKDDLGWNFSEHKQVR